MTAPTTPAIERGAQAALYTKRDGVGLWEPVRALSLAWAADDVAGAHAPVRVILAAALTEKLFTDVMADHGRDPLRDDIACLCGSWFRLHGDLRTHIAQCYLEEILGAA